MALDTFTRNPEQFDLVIAGQTMPQMTGATLARKMKDVRSGIPVVLCTGFSQVISAEEAQAQGIHAYLMKPLARKELDKAIRRVLDRDRCGVS